MGKIKFSISVAVAILAVVISLLFGVKFPIGIAYIIIVFIFY